MFYPTRLRFSLSLLVLICLSACTTFTPSRLHYSQLEIAKSDSSSSVDTVEYAVYTPPGWNKEESLPLIVFLHGLGDSHFSFEKNGAADYLDQQIAERSIPRVILLTPNGKNGFWENWEDGSYYFRDWVVREIMPKVQLEYNTLPCPDYCHLLGLSMGGYGAMRFAYFEKGLFSSVSSISAAIFTHEQNVKSRESFWLNLVVPFDRIYGAGFGEKYYRTHPFFAWSKEPHLKNTRLQLLWARHDKPNILVGNQAFQKTLIDQGIKHEHFIFEGKHNWASWRSNLASAIRFLTAEN